MITELTPEQEALIPVYREKWRAIALSTERIDRQKATEAIEALYSVNGFSRPEINFCASPYTALNTIVNLSQNQLGRALRQLLKDEPASQIINLIKSQFDRDLEWRIKTELYFELFDELNEELVDILYEDLTDKIYESSKLMEDCIVPQLWACKASYVDCSVSVLNCNIEQTEWQLVKSIIENCGLVFPFTKICLVCDRPIRLSFDKDNRLHAEGEPAIEFTDGYRFYYHHRVKLPEKYGAIHPKQWRAEWILEERNAELKRLLIQEIGYARLCQELNAEELDYWKEYSLLKIEDTNVVYDSELDYDDEDIDNFEDSRDSIHILKMTCPSTGFTHALRVPPDITSAREAIRWVNWGIDPEEFLVQT